MESTKVSALLVLAMLAFSSPMALACGSASCTTPSSGTGTTIPSVGGIVGTVSPVVGGVVGTVGGAVPTVGGVASPVVGTVTGAVPTVGGVASPVVGKVGGMVSPVVGTVGGMVSPVVGTVGGAVPTVGGVVGTVTPVVGTVGGAVPTVGGIVGIVAPIIGGGSPSPKRHGGRKACPPSPPTPTPSPPTPAPTPPTPAPTPPTPTPSPTPSSDTCPIDTLKLGVCLSILGNEVHIGDSKVKCCALVQGVAGLTAAACLCTAIKAKVLDLSLYVPLALSLLVNDCGCAVPPGYKCA